MQTNYVFSKDSTGIWHVYDKETGQIKERKHTSRTKAVAAFFHDHPGVTSFVIGILEVEGK